VRAVWFSAWKSIRNNRPKDNTANAKHVAMVPTVFGVFMGLAGLLGWHVHPDAIAKLLS
jgi:hypothetical protein